MEYPSEKQIEWGDASDILENLLKGTVSHGADYTLGPLEWATGYDISKDLLGIPDYEDWKQNYRLGFEEGDFGALRHVDKLSHLTGIIPGLAAYKGITMLPKGMEIAKRYFPGLKYWGDLGKMNMAYRLKQAKDAGTSVGLPSTRVARWLQKAKDFAKVPGQTVLRPIRHTFNPRRWSKKFDKYPHTSMPERELFKNVRDLAAIAGGTRVGVEGIKALVDRHPKKWDYSADEFDMSSAAPYQDKIMKIASDKPKWNIGVQLADDGPTYWG